MAAINIRDYGNYLHNQSEEDATMADDKKKKKKKPYDRATIERRIASRRASY